MIPTHIMLPSKLKVVSEDAANGVYEVDGLYPGYGHTLGSSLRRILLSSMPGAAITMVKIDGVSHEFSAIEGVREDAMTIILNLKRVRFQLHGDAPQTASLTAKGGIITAAQFSNNSELTVLNPDQYIAEITDKSKSLSIEVTVERGMGFVAREALKKEKVDIGAVFLDAVFSPVRRASYDVENMRVGDRTDFNRLRVTLETDGTVAPREALEASLRIMMEQFRAILNLSDAAHEVIAAPAAAAAASDDASESVDDEGSSEDRADLLKTRIESLQFTTRTMNALSTGGIRTLGGLIQKTSDDLLNLSGFGDRGLNEVKEVLTGFGLALRA
jgi:DNA-directed RNA polymerase subunit alpha